MQAALHWGMEQPWRWFILACIGAIAFALRVHCLTDHGLWTDEVFGATYNGLNPVDTVVAVLRFDIHPPLYYLQLNFWQAVTGPSDRSLLMNSVVLSLATWASITFIVLRQLGWRTALIVAGLVATALTETIYAQEVRMYALMSLLAVLGWWQADRAAVARARGRRQDLAFAAIIIALTLCHGASVIAVSALLLFWTARLKACGSLTLRRLGAVSLLVSGPLALVLLNSAVRSVSHTQPFTPLAALGTVSNWLWGDLSLDSGALGCRMLAAMMLALGLMYAWRVGGWLRATALCMVVWPLAIGFVLSLVVRPIWLDRTFAFCGPFAMLCLAALLAHWWTWARSRTFQTRFQVVAVAAAIVAMVTASTWASLQMLSRVRKMEYREAGSLLLLRSTPGDVIYVPDRTTFWGIARYVAGPKWGSALSVQDPVQSDQSTVWPQVYEKMGPFWVAALGLRGTERAISAGGRKMIIGPTPHVDVIQAGRLWLVLPVGDSVEELHVPCTTDRREQWQFRGVRVLLLDC